MPLKDKMCRMTVGVVNVQNGGAIKANSLRNKAKGHWQSLNKTNPNQLASEIAIDEACITQTKVEKRNKANENADARIDSTWGGG